MKTLEHLCRMKIKKEGLEYSPDFRMVVKSESADEVRVMIHPRGVRDNVYDFVLKGNEAKPI